MTLKAKRRLSLAVLALSALAAIIAGAIYAAGHTSETEVRVATQRLEDGRVEVAVQQRDADGGWGELQRPDARFLAADVIGEWRSSSPVVVHVAAPDAMPDGAMTDDAMTDADAPAALYCVVHHGQAGDPFWESFNRYLQITAGEGELTGLELHAAPDIDDHAAAISDCVEREALGIASTLPSLDKLREPLIAARQSGAYVVTFNSGAEFASLVGSAAHYGLDDRAAGALAGDKFNDAGATGPALCVVHERGNSGLADRCSGLTSTYDGDVERLDLSAGALADLAQSEQEIADAIAESGAGAVLVLNVALIEPAISAAGDGGALVGSIGRNLLRTDLILDGQLLFSIDDGDIIQAALVVQGFMLLDKSAFTRGLLALTAGATAGASTSLVLLDPAAQDLAYYQAVASGWQERLECLSNLEEGDDPAQCD